MTVTRADVARRAGVSPGLVSYVLNDGPRQVSPDKRARILAAIEELSYRPDQTARQLRTGKSHLIGLVVPDLRLPYYADAIEEVSTVLAEKGFQLLVGSSGWDSERERIQLRGLADRGVDGVVLMSVDPLQDFESLATERSPLVIVDRPQVAVDSATAVTAHLLEHGHQRVACISGQPEVVATARHLEGWRRALAEAGVEVEPGDHRPAEVSRAGGRVAGLALFDSARVPTAVYVESDAQAVGLLRAAYERGIRVPKDLAVATADGTDVARYTAPSLTTVEYPTHDIAEDALALVLDPAAPRVQRLSNAQFSLVRRESCGCISSDH